LNIQDNLPGARNQKFQVQTPGPSTVRSSGSVPWSTSRPASGTLFCRLESLGCL
jgi:hypothetical protein